jgi:hypothetical protein
MSNLKKTILGIIAVGGFLIAMAATYVTPILTTEIDPNLGKPQCPGGKDWDMQGSSCHDGIIVDYMLPPLSSKAISEGIRRGYMVRSTVEPRKKNRGR